MGLFKEFILLKCYCSKTFHSAVTTEFIIPHEFNAIYILLMHYQWCAVTCALR